MNPDDVPPDDGTPLHALSELRRAMADRFDRNTAEVLHAVERAQGAVVQADSAKTIQEEIRHLVRSLAAASESFILAPKNLQDAYLDVLQRLDGQVAALTAAIPRMPAAPDQLSARVAALAGQFDGFLSSCETRAEAVEQQLAAEIGRLTSYLARAAEDLRGHARAAGEPQARRDLWIFVAGLVMGLLVGALLWKPSDSWPRLRPAAILSLGDEQAPPLERVRWS
jgi:hypothetical protein